MLHRRHALALLVPVFAMLAFAWYSDSDTDGGGDLPVPPASGVPGLDLPRDATLGSGPEVVLAAGDIASCTNNNDEATAVILDGEPGTVITLGDLAYNNGTTTEFNNCYDPTWGRHKARTNPSPGNHEYNTANASGYYGYFGAAAGDPAKGYYSFDVGDWHLIALNSNCGFIGGCGTGSPQEQWLRSDLAAHANACVLAFWHHPRFSSGEVHGNNLGMTAFWQALYDYRAELSLVGHVHNYERFAKQTPAGVADATYGIRQFVVGTGGREHYGFDPPEPNSEVRDDTSFGVLKLTLHAASYDWEFLPVAGDTFTDSGSDTCEAGNSYDADYDAVADLTDNCLGLANPAQENADANLIDLPGKPYDDLTWANSDHAGDACDNDDDNDGIADADEEAPCAQASAATSPVVRDSDGDRTLDGAECALGSDPASAASKPPAIVLPDADSDGVPDDLDPDDGSLDSDGDALRDGLELRYYHTDLDAPNTDGDLCGDAKEVASVNGDTVVNAIDLSQVAQSFGGTDSGNYYVSFDANKDGTINALDLSFIAQRFGAC